jgi:hypothetical protein
MPEASSSPPSVRLLERVALASARVDLAATRQRERWRAFMRGLLTEALDTGELEALTVRLYEHGPSSFAGSSTQPWEEKMFDEWLPAPPARVLVTAAGSGREARALIARGYAVDALEPVPGMAAACAAVPGIGAVVQATHEDLARAVAGGGGPAAPLGDRRYDAVLVGWGSFTHVLSRHGQESLLRACDRLAPSGPILLSFFARHGGPASRSAALRAGTALGRRVAAQRRLPARDLEVGLAWNLGFTHALTEDEIAALAEGLRRRSEMVAEPYGHAVMRPGHTK